MTAADARSMAPPDVPFLDVRATWHELRDELDAATHRVFASGQYVLGAEVEAFEQEFASYCGAAHCVGVGNGLDALTLLLRAQGIGAGDEVLVPANTYIATWLAVTHAGARPIAVEPRADTCNLDPAAVDAAVTARTRAILAVHLYGQPAHMDALAAVASRHRLALFTDAAQAHGARWRGERAALLGNAAAFSFYPSKNLGAYGDGGAVVSNDATLIERVRRLRNYGSLARYQHEVVGFNSRLDPLQAAYLRIKLPYLDAWNARRAGVAKRYLDGLAVATQTTLPVVAEGATPSWHLFTIRHARRDRLRTRLAERGIATLIHYPVPPHLSGAYAERGGSRGEFPITEAIADTVLSLPIGPHLDAASVDRVIAAVLDAEASDE